MTEISEQQKKEINDFFLWGLPRTRRSKVIQSQNWFQVISEDYKSPSFNEVIFSDLSTDLFEEKVQEVIAQYTSVGTDFKWCIGPFSSPPKSKEILLEYGFQNWKARKMILPTENYQGTQRAENVTVEQVDSDKIEEFVSLFLSCWSIPKDESSQMRDQLLFDQERNGNFYRFISYVDDKPAGVASLVCNEKYGYFHATAVLPEFRGQGAYKALVDTRLQKLKSLSVPYAISGAREKTSAPILENLGFSTLWETDMFLKKVVP